MFSKAFSQLLLRRLAPVNSATEKYSFLPSMMPSEYVTETEVRGRFKRPFLNL
jgi:hypothetical protein